MRATSISSKAGAGVCRWVAVPTTPVVLPACAVRTAAATLLLSSLGVLVALAGPAGAAVVLYTSQSAFNAAGTVVENSDFDDYSGDYFFVSNPFTRGSVTYTSGGNLIMGAGVWAPPSNPVQSLMAFDDWSPVTATVATNPTQFTMLGFDAAVVSNGTNSPIDVTVTTNLDTYLFNGLSIALSSDGLSFLGFVSGGASEYITSFGIASELGAGYAPGITNVQLGLGVPEIDPAGMGSVLALVTGALGLLERRRMKPA